MGYIFGQHSGHLTTRATEIAARHGAEHINYTEPRGERRGWFVCPDLGRPFNEDTARAVLRDLDAEGGIESMRKGGRR